MKNAKKLSVLSLTFFIAVAVISCSSDKASVQNTNFTDFKEAFKVNAALTVTNNPDQILDGYLTIDDNNRVVIDFIEGSIKGTAQSDGSNYLINITQYDGVFRNMNGITGGVNTSNQTLNLGGQNIDNSHIAITGSLEQLLGADGEYLIEWGNTHSKSAYVFRNYGTCGASITLGDETLNGLTSGYVTSASCIESGILFSKLPYDVDNEDTGLVCSRIRLLALGGGGNYVDFDQCESASFIIDKNVDYNYTIHWENGQTETGHTGMLLGGRLITTCIGVNDPSCISSGGGPDLSPEEATVFYDGVLDTNGYCSSSINNSGGCTTTTVTVSSDNVYLTFFKLTNTGSVNVTVNTYTACVPELLGTIYNDTNPFAYATTTDFIGTFTWTGAKSFVYSCSWKNSGQTHSLSGQGLLP